MRNPAFCICANKGADQLRTYCAADQLLCFRYIGVTMPLLPESKISSLCPSTVVVQPVLCRTWSETPKIDFAVTWLIPIIFIFNNTRHAIRKHSFCLYGYKVSLGGISYYYTVVFWGFFIRRFCFFK